MSLLPPPKMGLRFWATLCSSTRELMAQNKVSMIFIYLFKLYTYNIFISFCLSRKKKVCSAKHCGTEVLATQHYTTNAH